MSPSLEVDLSSSHSSATRSGQTRPLCATEHAAERRSGTRKSRTLASWAAAVLLVLGPGALAAQTEPVPIPTTGTLFGRIIDQVTLSPVAGVVIRVQGGESTLQDISGPSGTFRIADVPIGERVLVLEHIAYGEYAIHVVVERGRDLRVDSKISQRAIEFDPIVVEALTEVERRRLTSGFNINEIQKEEIELAARSGMLLGDLVRTGLSGVRVSGGAREGEYLCVEYRGGRGSGATGCDEVAVYLDGVPISAPGFLYSTMTLDDIDRVEVLSPLESITRYGNRASGGALLIESRDTSLDERRDFARLPFGFDWSFEPDPYPWARVFASSFLGNAVGVGLGALLVRRCMEIERNEYAMSFKAQCDRIWVLGSGLLSVGLPAAFGGTAASAAGTTGLSRGRFLPSTFLGIISSTAGYLLVLRGETQDNQASRVAGVTILTVGTPVLMTLSDRLFRALR